MSEHSIKEQLLMTLSFFEPMTMEFIYLDFDDAFLAQHPTLSIEDLTFELQKLEEESLIIKEINDEVTTWKKVYPKKDN